MSMVALETWESILVQDGALRPVLERVRVHVPQFKCSEGLQWGARKNGMSESESSMRTSMNLSREKARIPLYISWGPGDS